MATPREQKFILFADNCLRARRVLCQPAAGNTEGWGPAVSDFGYIATASSEDDCPETDYLERVERQTEVRSAWDDSFIYFYVACEEPELEKARAWRAPTYHFENDFRNREDVQIHIDTEVLLDEVYALSVGIEGRLAQRKTKPKSERGNTAYHDNFLFRWDASVTYGAGHWLVIAKVPFAELGVRPSVGTELGINFTRNAFAGPEFSVWRGVGYWTVIPQRMGKLVLVDGDEPEDSDSTIVAHYGKGKLQLTRPESVNVTLKVNGQSGDSFAMNEGAENTFELACGGKSLTRVIDVISGREIFPCTQQQVPQKEILAKSFESMKEQSERFYAGDGIYICGAATAPTADRESPPLGLDSRIFRPDLGGQEIYYRHSSLKAEAFVYFNGVCPDDFYADRAQACLDFLVTQQRANGCMPTWAPRDPFSENSVPIEMHTSDCFYENGNVGRAMLAGYHAFGEQRYLNCAIGLAEFNMQEPISHNTNYNAFCLFFQPELTEITGDTRFIDDAVHKYEWGVRVGQMLNGEWPGHNRHTCYIGIIGLGIARLAHRLPADHMLHSELKERLIRLVNCFIGRLDLAEGVTHPHPKGSTNGASYALETAISAAEAFDFKLDGLIHHLVDWIVTDAGKTYPQNLPADMAALAHYMNWKNK